MGRIRSCLFLRILIFTVEFSYFWILRGPFLIRWDFLNPNLIQSSVYLKIRNKSATLDSTHNLKISHLNIFYHNFLFINISCKKGAWPKNHNFSLLTLYRPFSFQLKLKKKIEILYIQLAIRVNTCNKVLYKLPFEWTLLFLLV